MKIYMAGYGLQSVREEDSKPGSPRRLISYAYFLLPKTKINFEVAIEVIKRNWEKVKMISKKRIY